MVSIYAKFSIRLFCGFQAICRYVTEVWHSWQLFWGTVFSTYRKPFPIEVAALEFFLFGCLYFSHFLVPAVRVTTDQWFFVQYFRTHSCLQDSLTIHLCVIWFSGGAREAIRWNGSTKCFPRYLMAWNVNVVMCTWPPLSPASTYMNQEVSNFVIRWFLCIVGTPHGWSSALWNNILRW